MVPGTSSIMASRSPTRRLNKVLLPTFGLPTSAILQAIERDKKAMSGELRLALPVGIGECRVFTVSRDVLVRAIEKHRSWRRFES